MGFTFDDTDKKGVATPIAEMERLVEENPRNAEAIYPYIGGEEINKSPTHEHHRYVINFRDYPLCREDMSQSWNESNAKERDQMRRQPTVPLDYSDPVAADWPELLAIAGSRVKPQRAALPQKNNINREATRYWWRFLAYRQGLRASIANLARVVVISPLRSELRLYVRAPLASFTTTPSLCFPLTLTPLFARSNRVPTRSGHGSLDRL